MCQVIAINIVNAYSDNISVQILLHRHSIKPNKAEVSREMSLLPSIVLIAWCIRLFTEDIV